MNKSGDLKSPLGQLTSIPKKTTEQLVKEPLETVEKVEEQAGVKPIPSQNPANDSNPADALNSTSTDIPSKKTTLEIIKKMYEASDTKTKAPSDEIISAVMEENPKKTPDEIQKIAATRQQLWQQQHKDTYFDPTFNPQGKPQEERPSEKMEKEKKEKKQMEALELQKEEKKKEELSPTVKQGTVERNPGASG